MIAVRSEHKYQWNSQNNLRTALKFAIRERNEWNKIMWASLSHFTCEKQSWGLMNYAELCCKHICMKDSSAHGCSDAICKILHRSFQTVWIFSNCKPIIIFLSATVKCKAKDKICVCSVYLLFHFLNFKERVPSSFLSILDWSFVKNNENAEPLIYFILVWCVKRFVNHTALLAASHSNYLLLSQSSSYILPLLLHFYLQQPAVGLHSLMPLSLK